MEAIRILLTSSLYFVFLRCALSAGCNNYSNSCRVAEDDSTLGRASIVGSSELEKLEMHAECFINCLSHYNYRGEFIYQVSKSRPVFFKHLGLTANYSVASYSY